MPQEQIDLHSDSSADQGRDVPEVNHEEVIKTVETSSDAKSENDPFAKGRERIASIGEFFSKAKDKAKSLFSKIGGAFSRFGSKAKSFGGEALAATLSADVLAKKGYEVVSEKVSEKGAQAAEFVESNYEKARDFVQDKAEQIQEFAQDKIELAKDIAAFAAGKTKEGLEKVKGGIENRYNKIKAFGENAFAAAKMEVARIKDAYRQKMNEIRMNRLIAEHERILQKEQEAADKAEALRQKREILLEKMNLLQMVGGAV